MTSIKSSDVINVRPPPPGSHRSLRFRPAVHIACGARTDGGAVPRAANQRLSDVSCACQVLQLIGGVAGLLIYIALTAINTRFFPFLVRPAAAMHGSPPAAAVLPV
jgi:hypothetical protein